MAEDLEIAESKASGSTQDVQPLLHTEGCNHSLPTWGVTRQFDFGQFVILYDERVVNCKREVTPIVISDEGDIVVREEVEESAVTKSPVSTTGGVPIHLLYETENAVELINSREALEIPVLQLDRFLNGGQVKHGEAIYRPDLPSDVRAKLAIGLPVTALGRAWDPGKEVERRVLFRFQSFIENFQIN